MAYGSQIRGRRCQKSHNGFNMSKKIYIASPKVFNHKELQEYEKRILDNKNVTEHQASKFFMQFPQFLSIGDYAELAREVVLYKGNGDEMYRVDFCRRIFGERLWDIVELKSPAKPYVVKSGNHWKYASKIETAVHQAQNYGDHFEIEMNRLELQRREDIKIFRPEILIIGGRSNDDIDPIELRRLASRYARIDIKSLMISTTLPRIIISQV